MKNTKLFFTVIILEFYGKTNFRNKSNSHIDRNFKIEVENGVKVKMEY